MQIDNPFQMNDWEIKRFLKIVLVIQLAVWGVMGLDVVGVELPILRQLIGFIYLTVIPGILIIRILKLHKLGSIETLLYTVGLSIATLMFTGLFMNTVYPIFDISGPISITPFIITISILVLILCILSYVRDRDYSNPSFMDTGEILSPPALFLCLIPFLAIFGTYLMNFYHNNILLMFLIVIIALIVVLIGFDKFIPKNLYPLAVFIIAISLLFHRSLISMYLWGWDIQLEYYLCNLVKMDGIWDSTNPIMYNAMLSITMLAPIFSDICSMSLIWVLKIIYTLLFSLVPLGLYPAFQKQTDDKIAFLACFFFISLFVFYGEMLQLARQQIAELFLVLLILLTIDKDMTKIKRSFLFIVFGISLVVSHYGLSYIYMFSLTSAWMILVLAENPAIQELRNNLYSKFSRYTDEKLAGNPNSLDAKNRTISSTFVIMFITFALAWYLYIASSSAFNVIVSIGSHIASSIFTDFLNPEAAEGLSRMLEETASPLHSATKYLHLIAQIFIAVGILTLLLKGNKIKFKKEFVAFSMVNFVICLGAIGLPYFAGALHTTRIYHITLFILAPFFVIGGIMFFRVLSEIVRASWTNRGVRSSLKVLSVFLAIFLLFNSGFVYEVAKDHPTSISLNNTIDYPRFNEQEVLGAKWLTEIKGDKSIYTDANGVLLLGSFEWGQAGDIDRIRIPKDSYIYLRKINIMNGTVLISPEEKVNSSAIVNGRGKIYTNRCVQVYY